VLADRFDGRVAEHPLGGMVPRGDDAVEGLADDGIGQAPQESAI
jgi:hypothetical protein